MEQTEIEEPGNDPEVIPTLADDTSNQSHVPEENITSK
jgi:hypothetical protein